MRTVMKVLASTMVLIGLIVGLDGCGMIQAEASRTSPSRTPPRVIQAEFVPADSWSNLPSSRGYVAHYVSVFHGWWMPLSLVRKIMTDIGISTDFDKDRLEFSASAMGATNLRSTPAPPSGGFIALDMPGYAAVWLPLLRKPGSGTPYLPVVKTIAALRRLHIKMRWHIDSQTKEITWTLGAPDYRAIFVSTRMKPDGSETAGGMLWVHDGTTWISANTLGNALQQAGGIGVQWPINGNGVIERVEISVPPGIHVDWTLWSGHASKGIREVPLLINGRRMGYVRWSTTPDGPYYFSTKSMLPLIHRINLFSQWTGSSQGVVHWALNPGKR